jgi:hypothetical protein
MRMVVLLPAPFGSQEPDDLAAGHLERHVLDGGEGAKALGESLGGDHGSGRHRWEVSGRTMAESPS